MEESASSKKPLVWPTLIDFDKPIVEHIQYQSERLTFAELLFEIECEYPHVSKKLELLIGHPEFEMEMNKLLIPDRIGRQGFSKTALSNLLKMSKLHTETYGQLLKTHDCVWSKNRA